MNENIRDIDLLKLTIDQIGGLKVQAGDRDTVLAIWDILHNLTALEQAMEERDRKAQEAGGEADVPD